MDPVSVATLHRPLATPHWSIAQTTHVLGPCLPSLSFSGTSALVPGLWPSLPTMCPSPYLWCLLSPALWSLLSPDLRSLPSPDLWSLRRLLTSCPLRGGGGPTNRSNNQGLVPDPPPPMHPCCRGSGVQALCARLNFSSGGWHEPRVSKDCRENPGTPKGPALTGGATMGWVRFSAMSSTRACHCGLHCLQFSVTDPVHCRALWESSAGVVPQKSCP